MELTKLCRPAEPAEFRRKIKPVKSTVEGDEKLVVKFNLGYEFSRDQQFIIYQRRLAIRGAASLGETAARIKTVRAGLGIVGIQTNGIRR